jgi:hypothetical protein
MSKHTIDIVTVSRYGRPEYYYWVLQLIGEGTLKNIYIGNSVKTEDEAYDDLGEFVAKLIEQVKVNEN